ncbi:phage tail protein [Deinococcus roseus]|uniref:Phage tail protein n=1 Tax=Deinococcus roseus TaxID=392414 RepID=A0ABQ2CYN4_9DEIO|nr:phage tail protein [Deinococcus roseus]GGJ33380.1 hypothetical protein GCM10008938_19530 [Deinococcus roseus]
MDVNGSGYHLLLGQTDWESSIGGFHLGYDQTSQAVTLAPEVFHFQTHPSDHLPTAADLRSIGADAWGNVYLISEDRTKVQVLAPQTRIPQTYWTGDMAAPSREHGAFSDQPAASPAPVLLNALAVTESQRLVVAADRTLYVFDLVAGGPPLPEQVDFAPSGRIQHLYPRVEGGFWLLEQQGDQAHLWTFDAQLRPIPTETTAQEATFADVGDTRTLQKVTGSFHDLGQVQVLQMVFPDRERGVLLTHQGVFQWTSQNGLQDLKLKLPDGFERGYALHALPSCIFLVEKQGNQALKYRTGATLPESCYFPMRDFVGKGLVLVRDRIHYHSENGILPLAEQPRPRFKTTGQLLYCFDGKEAGCVWHRLFLDADLEPDTRIEIRAYATNQALPPNQAPRSRWLKPQPTPYTRGMGRELPLEPLDAGFRTLETLFQEVQGRYLYLEVTLQGSGRTTPRIRALRAYYPRFSYLQYLPGIFRENPESASLLERFLANTEGIFTDLEGRIAASEKRFDPHSTPAEDLEWLASWMGIEFPGHFNGQQKRFMVQHASTMLPLRGTRRGLEMLLNLSLDPYPAPSTLDPECSRVKVLEDIRTPHQFQVVILLPDGVPEVEELERQVQLLTLITEQNKPAHTRFEVYFDWALFKVGSAVLGSGTALKEVPLSRLLPSLILGRNPLLSRLWDAGTDPRWVL